MVRLLVHWRKTTKFYFPNASLLVELPTPTPITDATIDATIDFSLRPFFSWLTICYKDQLSAKSVMYLLPRINIRINYF